MLLLRVDRPKEGLIVEAAERFECIGMIAKLGHQIALLNQATYGIRFSMAILGTDRQFCEGPWPGDINYNDE